jgi:hypothetical protein
MHYCIARLGTQSIAVSQKSHSNGEAAIKDCKEQLAKLKPGQYGYAESKAS